MPRRKRTPEEQEQARQFKEMLGPSREKPGMIACACCGIMFQDDDMPAIARAIMSHEPACSYECNKALGQV